MTVRAQITGELTSVKFQQGDDVQAGQELFTLDRRPLEAALLQADSQPRARFGQRRQREGDPAAAGGAGAARHCRARAARHGAHAVSPRSKRRWPSDRAAVENAKVQLQYATIRAPISGRTGALMVTAGNLVRANDQTPLVTINQVTPIYVSFAFPEAMLADLRRYMARGTLQRRGEAGQRPGAARAPSAASPSWTTPSIRRRERSRSRARSPTRTGHSGPGSSPTSSSG